MSDGLEEAVKAVEAAHAEPVEAKQEPGEQLEKLDVSDEPEAEETEGNEAETTDDSEAEETSDTETGEDDSEDASDDSDDDDEGGKKRRSKPASVRIAELTAKLREAERKLEAVSQPEPEGQEGASEPVEPKPEDFEYGEADPAYQRAIAKYDRDVEKVEERKTQKVQQQRQAMLERINAGMEKASAEASEKYEDFEERIAEAVAARGGQSLPPALAIGVSMSPVGGDIAYRLATDAEASTRLEGLAKGGEQTANQMAMAFGELEGEYLSDTSDADLDMSDALDMARMMGRMRARMAGRNAKPEPKEEVSPKIVPTNAPEPPEKRVRGSAGKARASMDTEDTAAFVRDFGKKLGL